MFRRLIAAFAISVIAFTVATIGPAGADPKGFGPIAVDCGSAGSFNIMSPGNGAFTPGLVIGSTTVLIPLRLTNQSMTYTDPGGTTYPPEFPPDVVKGSNKKAGVDCTFSFNIDTGNGLENISGGGDVLVKITPGK